MEITTITVFDKNLVFDKKFLDLYKEKTLSSLEEMVPGFLFGEYNNICNFERESVLSYISSKSEKELEVVLLKWAKFDLKTLGVAFE